MDKNTEGIQHLQLFLYNWWGLVPIAIGPLQVCVVCRGSSPWDIYRIKPSEGHQV